MLKKCLWEPAEEEKVEFTGMLLTLSNLHLIKYHFMQVCFVK